MREVECTNTSSINLNHYPPQTQLQAIYHSGSFSLLRVRHLNWDFVAEVDQEERWVVPHCGTASFDARIYKSHAISVFMFSSHYSYRGGAVRI
jgi:hypothetical protein